MGLGRLFQLVHIRCISFQKECIQFYFLLEFLRQLSFALLEICMFLQLQSLEHRIDPLGHRIDPLGHRFALLGRRFVLLGRILDLL